MKKQLLVAIIMLTVSSIMAQVKVGDNPTSINTNSVLEIESTNKGVLFPRIALTATNNASPLATFVAGMTVYNTATAGSGATAVSPGLYYCNGTQWVAVNPNFTPDAALGTLAVFPFTAIPSDYLLCNGQAVSRTTYASLFAKIGTTYGAGDGSTTFNLPDLRGEFIRGLDNGRGVDAGRTIGSTQAGATARPTISFTGTTSTDGAHSHGPSNNGSFVVGGTGGNGAANIGNGSGWRVAFDTDVSGSHNHTTTITGGGDSETRPRNVAMVYAIKAQESIVVPSSTSAAVSAAAAANEPWFKTGTGTGATANTDDVFLNGSVGIGNTGAVSSAALEVSSTSKGFLPPRMTAAQRTAISTPATGLLVFQTDASAGYWYYDGTKWVLLQTTTDLIGSVSIFAMSSVPSGYLVCNGAAVSRTTYADLFARIGTTYGAGDGSTTFNLPDLRGEFVRGLDNGRGVDAGRTIGSTQAGATARPTTSFTGTTSTDGDHTHTNPGGTSLLGGGAGGSGANISIGGGNYRVYTATATNGNHNHTTTITGGGDSETRPRNVAMVYAIKAF